MRPIPQDRCLPLIQHFEGKDGKFEAEPTLDPVGNWEIGWGHKLSGPGPKPDVLPIDSVAADQLAVKDLRAAGDGVYTALGQEVADGLTDGQYGALCCFTYNEGVEAFDGSTMCRLVKAGNLVRAIYEFEKWVYAHDPVTHQPVVEPGLVRRRLAEKSMWLS